MPKTIWGRYGYVWVTLVFFLISLIGHWILGWYAFAQEALEHGQPAEFSNFLIEIGRDTLENWQSEFLQLIWQVAGLSLLFYVGSTQSREGDERLEKKIDQILRATDKDAAQKISEIDKRYLRT